jgi:hypothetical protein
LGAVGGGFEAKAIGVVWVGLGGWVGHCWLSASKSESRVMSVISCCLAIVAIQISPSGIGRPLRLSLSLISP